MKVCAECGEEFTPGPDTRKNYRPQRFCSTKCRQRQWFRNKTDRDPIFYYTHLLRTRRQSALSRRSVRAARRSERQEERS